MDTQLYDADNICDYCNSRLQLENECEWCSHHKLDDNPCISCNPKINRFNQIICLSCFECGISEEEIYFCLTCNCFCLSEILEKNSICIAEKHDILKDKKEISLKSHYAFHCYITTNEKGEFFVLNKDNPSDIIMLKDLHVSDRKLIEINWPSFTKNFSHELTQEDIKDLLYKK